MIIMNYLIINLIMVPIVSSWDQYFRMHTFYQIFLSCEDIFWDQFDLNIYDPLTIILLNIFSKEKKKGGGYLFLER
jgi:hypothetical protein